MNRVIRLTPEHTLRRAAKRFLEAPGDNCPKCESTYVRREPAFIHCRCCGNLARIANASPSKPRTATPVPGPASHNSDDPVTQDTSCYTAADRTSADPVRRRYTA